MIQIGMEVILIKVAGIGLLPEHLGKTLAQMRPHLIKLVRNRMVFINPISKVAPRITSTVLMFVEKEESMKR